MIPAPGQRQWKEVPCLICDANEDADTIKPVDRFWNEVEEQEDWKDAVAALLAITEIPEFKESTKPRILMALAISRMFRHISDPTYLNLEKCSLGQWLLASMSRSLRELRIAATYVSSSTRMSLIDDMQRSTHGLLTRRCSQECTCEESYLFTGILPYARKERLASRTRNTHLGLW